MEDLHEVFIPLLVWLGFPLLIGFFAMMYKWARKQKGAAMAFGMLVQMFLPDPKVQQTIEFVVEAKQEKDEKSSPSRSKNKEEA